MTDRQAMALAIVASVAFICAAVVGVVERTYRPCPCPVAAPQETRP
jgi:hypothetical protein